MKPCYTLTFLRINANGGRDFRINSTIWLQNNGTRASALSAAELDVLATYIQNEICTVWDSFINPGLSSGLGQVIYNSSYDTITCQPPDGGGAPGDTGVVVKRFSQRAIAAPFPIQGEILFQVNKGNDPKTRAFIDARAQIGQLFYPGISVAGVPPNQSYHNTAAHEFGHALGLADRYHYIANGRATNNNASTDNNFLCRSDGGFPPMYLPGLFIATNEYDTDEFTESEPFYLQPPYDRDPYTRLLFDGTQHPLLRLTGSLPQPNYNGSTNIEVPDVYDIEYNHGFTWLHNLMSSRRPVNTITLPVPIRNQHPFTDVRQNDATGALYRQMYQNEFGNPLQVVPITKVQLDIVLDIVDEPEVYITNKIYRSWRFEVGTESEPGMTEARGFSRRIFDQFLFIFSAENREVCGFAQSRADSDLTRPYRPDNAAQPFFLDGEFDNFRKVNGTFIGIAYEEELDKDGNGGHVVSDIDFAVGQPHLRDGGLVGYHGIHDIMSYRMSIFEPTGLAANVWSLKNVKHADSSDKIIGFINPHLSAERSPKSVSINDLLSSTYSDFYNSPPGADINPTVADFVLNYGGPLVMFYIARMIDLDINGGVFLENALRDPKVRQLLTKQSMQYTIDEDLYKDVGIADENGRQIWNGISSYGLPARFAARVRGAAGVNLVWDPNPGGGSGWAVLRANFTFAMNPDGLSDSNARGNMEDYYQLVLPSYINRRVIVNLVMP